MGLRASYVRDVKTLDSIYLKFNLDLAFHRDSLIVLQLYIRVYLLNI